MRLSRLSREIVREFSDVELVKFFIDIIEGCSETEKAIIYGFLKSFAIEFDDN